MNELTEESFLKYVSNHKMTVIRDDEASRHIRFREPGTIFYAFDLITWPYHLCITGDCGTYVFSRNKDMFNFFRDEDRRNKKTLFINPGYWGEKLLSISVNGGYKEFDEDEFRARVTDQFNSWKEDEDQEAEKAEDIWNEITDQVLSRTDDGEIFAYEAAYDFVHKGFKFQDFFDGGGTERYTPHYLWCLYAIAWGIQQYDDARAKAA